MKMKNSRIRSSGGFMISVLACVMLSNQCSAQTIRDTTATARTAPNQTGGFFTGGHASVSRVTAVPEINCGVAKVSFDAGVRTIWHSHAGGQIITVVSGTAWYQEKGKPKQIIHQGESVICPPNVMHWHGASPEGPMAHTVVTPNLNKGGVTIGPPVTDEEYNGQN